jgi:hypothetical protein
VIPEELGLPPTFTILSLGKRLAKHLMKTDEGYKIESAAEVQAV